MYQTVVQNDCLCVTLSAFKTRWV